MSVTIQDFDLTTTFALDKKLLQFAGFYPQTRASHNYLYFFKATINIFFSISQLISMIIQIIIDRNDVSKLSESLQYLTTLITFVLKLTCFAINKKSLLEIEDALTSPTFYGYPEHHLKVLKQKIGFGQAAGTAFRVSCVAAVSFYALLPFFDDQKPRNLLVPGWFPYNVSDYYYSTFTFQTLGIANTAYTNSAIDILSWVLISIASGQFEVLKENLKSIDYGSEDLVQVEKAFKKCVKHHEEIIKLVHKIEIVCSVVVFLQFAASVIVICFTGFLLVTIPVVSIQFTVTFSYFICMMCQVAMYCWIGQDIMSTSNTLGESFYLSNWYESDLRIRKNIFIFMEKTKRPVTLSAAGFVTLSLTTFTTILRSSYSYFAVLQRMYLSN